MLWLGRLKQTTKIHFFSVPWTRMSSCCLLYPYISLQFRSIIEFDGNPSPLKKRKIDTEVRHEDSCHEIGTICMRFIDI